jgi:hypothetical protein
LPWTPRMLEPAVAGTAMRRKHAQEQAVVGA